MKKTLAIILSIVMLIGVMPFASFAAEPAYDRAAVAANDEAYIADMTAEQMASVILDWVDREIAKYSADIKDAVVEGVVANGFEGFEISAFGDVIAAQIPDIDSLDAVIGYKSYLTELGGTFAELDATNLVTRAEAGTALDFIYGVFQFMADNSEKFGRVFRWDEEVFDYGKVGDYIETLNGSENADEQAIYDFYMNYLVGNDIQAKFTKWVADQMGYEIPEDETFDDTLNNGILGWFSGLCETNGILSEEALAELRTYDLRTTDIYTLVKNFVALAEEDNEVKLDTYYNYLLDTVVRTLLKTTLGQVATADAAAEVPEGFTATYTDLALLEEISGGKVYYKDGDAYYEVTVADGVATAKTLTWEAGLDLNFEPPVATIYTGADGTTKVAEYKPSSTKFLSADTMPVYMYTAANNQTLINSVLTGGDETKTGLTFAGTEIPADYAALMTDANKKALADRFIFKVEGTDEKGAALTIPAVDIDLSEVEAYAEAEALKVAQETVASMNMGVTVKSVDVVISYTGWATEDEFIAQVAIDDYVAVVNQTYLGDIEVKKDTVITVPVINMELDLGTMMTNAVNSVISNPLMTIVVDDLKGDLNIDDAKALVDYIDTDFTIDNALLDFSANYDKYNGVVGQVNHILVGLVNMLLSPSGEAAFNLTDGNNDNLYANLDKICKTANDIMAAAESVMNNAGLQDMIKALGIDLSAILGELPLDLLYAINFESVEDLWVSVITLGLDLIDDGTNETIKKIHSLIGDLTNLDAMAVALTDYALGKCIPDLNKALADAGVDFALTVPTATEAAAVADGAGKDIIMTKAADLLYEAATEGVALVNTIANDALATIATETGIEMPTVAFELKVEKGADWEATLAALTDRVYALANGIIIACDNEYTDTFDKIAAVANSILPLGSLASNCASENFAFDINLVLGYLFDDALEGDLDGFLRLYETKEKTEDVAADVSVTEALIKASEHIVDAFFPDTVKSELYVDNYETGKFTDITVQEYFTGAENDAVIASNNMDSINARKAYLVPATLLLVREAGVLPFFAKCDKDHTAADLETITVAGTAATCTEAGVEDTVKCAECGYVVSGGGAIPAQGHKMGNWTQTKAPTCEDKGEETRNCTVCGKNPETRSIAALGHKFGDWKVTKTATCTEKGVETRTCTCGKSETRDIAKTDHPDTDGNKICDACGHDWNEKEDTSFFGKIKAFFQRIIDWFKNLFNF